MNPEKQRGLFPQDDVGLAFITKRFNGHFLAKRIEGFVPRVLEIIYYTTHNIGMQVGS